MQKLAPVIFPSQRLDLIAGREHGHFWHEPRTRLILETIRRARLAPGARILDVGCGTGEMVQRLRAEGFDASGIDPWAASHAGTHAIVGQAEALPAPDASVAAVCGFDVLEHADDAAALAEMSRVLESGGALFLSVPAHQFLWSMRDEIAGHRRRYSRRSLRRVVVEAGFEVERLFGYQFALLPALAFARLVSRRSTGRALATEDAPSAPVNALLRAVNRTEVALGRVRRPPTGSSLLLVARKARGRS